MFFLMQDHNSHHFKWVEKWDVKAILDDSIKPTSLFVNAWLLRFHIYSPCQYLSERSWLSSEVEGSQESMGDQQLEGGTNPAQRLSM